MSGLLASMKIFQRVVWLCCGAMACALPAQALQLALDNDGIVTSGDKHYTQGARWSLDRIELGPESSAGWLALPLLPGAATDRHSAQWIAIGQQLYTPDHVRTTTNQPDDRPYAGWLYTGGALFQESDQHFARAELLLGMVGPSAGGEPLQNGFHKVFAFPRAAGWQYQLDDVPVVVATYEVGAAQKLFEAGPAKVSAVPQLGVTTGNLFRDVHLSLLVRAGTLATLRYGPDQMRTGYSGLPLARNDRMHGGQWALWGGVEGREVFYNRLLQGDRDHPGVERQRQGLDVMVGGALALSPHWLIQGTALDRHREFVGQPSHDRYGGVSIVRTGF
jgi:lipid A 3-O-deacylase